MRHDLRQHDGCGFLLGILAYYVTDAAWGLFAGLRWMGPWYVDTVLFFLSMAVFVVMWGRFKVLLSKAGVRQIDCACGKLMEAFASVRG